MSDGPVSACCSCGKPHDEDGGREGVCECCSTCTVPYMLGDVILDNYGCCWRYSGTETAHLGHRWETFDGTVLSRSDPPHPLTLIIRNGHQV